MPKDNENLSLPFIGPAQPSEREGFAFEEMVTCDDCLRSNPPTRMACFYCGSTLPVTESSVQLRKPTLIQPDKLRPGYNTIFIAKSQTAFDVKKLHEAGRFLKLTPESLQRLLAAPVPLPLAHTASEEEANLVTQRMSDFGIDTCTVSDEELGNFERCVVRIRSIQFDETSFSLRSSSGGHDKEVAYADLVLLVQGRLVIKTTEVKERKSRTAENELLDASEFFADQPVVDICSSTDPETWRVAANNFDFSCLLDQKTLVAGENISKLVKLIKAKAPQIEIDDHYNSLRQALESVWGLESETKSRGWRRGAPGWLTLEAATTDSNETQFTRYSRLRYHTVRKPIG
ncbi:MAG TPA: hypothetical protein VF074_04185 [Pyrinomonadaceae bacterium]